MFIQAQNNKATICYVLYPEMNWTIINMVCKIQNWIKYHRDWQLELWTNHTLNNDEVLIKLFSHIWKLYFQNTNACIVYITHTTYYPGVLYIRNIIYIILYGRVMVPVTISMIDGVRYYNLWTYGGGCKMVIQHYIQH